MVYFKTRETLLLGWLAFKSFRARLLQDFTTPHKWLYGANPNKEHAMKRKSGKRSFKRLCLEISFSWFKVVFLMKR
ncbi:hypothetical protein [Helicobacter pylori]|uniref:hypothetical protein n=1 Tax=Helicobacter pylori TaxID=210 RepID=UPI000AF614A4|nr:hypothetical protein [Helicobacter pylori]